MKKSAEYLKGFIAYDLGLLRNRFFRKTKKILNKYYNKQNFASPLTNRTLIYMLDGRAYSGGLTDILRGIISMFKFSKETGLDFRINFCFPYNLQDYLVPNQYNWLIPENEISYNSDCSIPIWIYCSHSNYRRSREFENEFQRKILRKFIKSNPTKQQFHIYTNSQFTEESEYSSLFNELFKPSDRLQSVLKNHKIFLGAEYISMTFRFQQLLGDFVQEENSKDKTSEIIILLNKTGIQNEKILPDFGELQLRALLGDFKNKKISEPLDDNEKDLLVKSCLKKIIELHSTLYPEFKILVTADSEYFLKEVSQLEYVYAVSGKQIYGSDYGGNRYNIFIKPFIDIYMLSEANTIFLLYTEKMFRSGFAKNASYINNKEYIEIHF